MTRRSRKYFERKHILAWADTFLSINGVIVPFTPLIYKKSGEKGPIIRLETVDDLPHLPKKNNEFL